MYIYFYLNWLILGNGWLLSLSPYSRKSTFSNDFTKQVDKPHKFLWKCFTKIFQCKPQWRLCGLQSKTFHPPPTLKTVISKLSHFARQLYQKDIYQFNTNAITCYISYYESWIDESIMPEIYFCTLAPDSANLIAYMKSKRASAPAHTLMWQWPYLFNTYVYILYIYCSYWHFWQQSYGFRHCSLNWL